MQNIFLSCLLFAFVLGSCTQPAGLYRKGMVTPENYTDRVGDTLKVLSWNVEHFLDSHDNPYTQNRREDSSQNMEGRTALLVEALRQADADIVVLQEFEHVQLLRQLAQDSLSEMGYTFFADHESINWYMNVVVMSRVPLGVVYGYGAVTTPVVYRDEKTGELRKESQSMINTRMWSVDVLVSPAYSFLLTGVHLKAGRGARHEAMRMGQLAFLKEQYARFLREDKRKNILLVGDFNATPESRELELMKTGKGGARFVDNLPKEVFSHPAEAPKWRIDHILPNANMQNELVEVQVVYFFDKATQRKLADHLPLVATFVTRER